MRTLRENMKPTKCKLCKKMATKTTPEPAQFLLYGCKEHRITFGVYSDYLAGKNQKQHCEEFLRVRKRPERSLKQFDACLTG